MYTSIDIAIDRRSSGGDAGWVLPMTGPGSLAWQIDEDFVRARRRAFFRRMWAHLRGDPASGRLLPFEEARATLRTVNRVHLGIKEVPTREIVGSVGRHSDFDGAFSPARASVETRWKRIDRAFLKDEELPPVSLYKVGDAYFVNDGNHRVSVARFHGVEFVDADVVEFGAARPAREGRGAPKATEGCGWARRRWTRRDRPGKKRTGPTKTTGRWTCRG